MRRRDFIRLLGGAAAWPLAARAQQGDRVRRIGVLIGGADDAFSRTNLAAFQDALRKLGWSEGQNAIFDIRWASSAGERRAGYAAELVALNPDVILASTGPVVRALTRETTKIPIVLASGGDIVEGGVIQNLARPEGNVTGFPSTEISLAGKWLDLLKELAPSSSRVAVIAAPENGSNPKYWNSAQVAARGKFAEMIMIETRDDAQIEREVEQFANNPDGALLVLPGASTIDRRDGIIEAAAQHRLPTIYPFRVFAASGGLMSYGSDNADRFRRAAVYVDRLLRGDAVVNLPVQFPTKYDLIINITTAKTLGLIVPTALLVAADEVIE